VWQVWPTSVWVSSVKPYNLSTYSIGAGARGGWTGLGGYGWENVSEGRRPCAPPLPLFAGEVGRRTVASWREQLLGRADCGIVLRSFCSPPPHEVCNLLTYVPTCLNTCFWQCA